jgi:peptide/nickel transport system permease protein
MSTNIPQSDAASGLGFVLRRGDRPSYLSSTIRFIQRKPLGAAGGLAIALLVFVAIAAPLLAPYDAFEHNPPDRMQPPSAQHLTGTDVFGRDQLSRIIYGSRVSLYVGLVSVILGTSLGMAVGVTSAYVGGKFDLLVQRVVDTMMGFPGLVLVLIMVVALGPSLNNVTLAIAVNFVDKVVRLSRASALSVKEEGYVMSARAFGASALRIIGKHITPNSLAPIFVLATGQLGSAIVTEAGLSFLGLGVPPPHPSWGNMLQGAAKEHLEDASWLAVYPGVALASVTFSFAVFGDALRDVLDPRLRGS